MKKLPSLNGLRAISITIVILFHLSRFNIRVAQDSILRIPILNGRFGVGVFFVISGFLITSLLLREEEISGSISIKNFYLRRVLRIFPAYFILLLVYLILQLLGYLHISKEAWLTALTYTKYFNYKVEFYTSHAWSLSIEENFYLFWPMIFLLGGRKRKEVAWILILLVPFIRLYVFYYPINWISDQSLFIRIDSIATGCLFALYRNEILAKLRLHWDVLFYWSVAILFLIPWVALLADNTFFSLIFVFLGVLTGTIANLLIAIIMMYSVYGPRGRWFAILNSKALDYIGTLSYSLYLWQQLFVFRKPWWVTHFPQNIVFIFLAAMFSYYIIEKPFLKLKSRFSGKKAQAPTITHAASIP